MALICRVVGIDNTLWHSYNEVMSYNRLDVWARQFGADSLMGMDACGHPVMRDAAEKSPFAWDVDHIFPKVWLEKLNVAEEKIDDPQNLQVLQASTNRAKEDDYPSFSDIDGQEHRIRSAYRQKLAALYKPEIEVFLSLWVCVSRLNNGAPNGGHTPEECEMMDFLRHAGLVGEA